MRQYSAMRYRVADLTIDVPAMHLERGGLRVPVEPQVFDVIRHLLEHRDRVVLKTELLDTVWGDRFVSESTLSSRIKSARQALGDNGTDQRIIRTVHGRGFRFVGRIVAADDAHPGAVSGPAEPELSDLDRVLAGMRSGHGAAVAIPWVGGGADPAELTSLLGAGRDAGWRAARASAAADLRPYAGLIGAFGRWLRADPALAGALPQGAREEIEALVTTGRISSRQRLVVAAGLLVTAVCDRAGGAVLVIDDIHLADDETRDLLRVLTSRIRSLPFLLVATHPAGFDAGGEFESVQAEGAGAGAGAATVDPGAGPVVPPLIRDLLRAAATIGEPVEQTDLGVVADGLTDREVRRALELATAGGILRAEEGRFWFVHRAQAELLRSEVADHRRQELHAAIAGALIEREAEPDRIARHLVAAGDEGGAARFALAAAREAAASNLHAQVTRWTRLAMDHLPAAERSEALVLRADAMIGMGDRSSIGLYREALRTAPAETATGIRVRLGRALLLAEDIVGAAEVLDGLETDGGPADGQLLTIKATLAYYRGDLDTAERLAEAARPFALQPEGPDRSIDIVALQGLIAHNRGQWFDRIRQEMTFSATSNELASALFDAYICLGEYVIHGPTPRAEVTRLFGNVARTAERSNARPALGWARALIGEARYLDGNLDGARASLDVALEVYRAIGSTTGEAYALQSLGQVAIAEGNRDLADDHARQALALARWSPMSHHLLPRIFGTLIDAAPDAETGAARAREAEETLDEPEACPSCEVFGSVPLAIAFAGVGALDPARRHLEVAERSARRWVGDSRPAAVTEARAWVTAAEGDRTRAAELFAEAARRFEAARQPRDVARCRAALVAGT
jgi:DNA-binding winged helix-turn-helix (wHTH) protein/tetratricopeptide (TPR) repeat protein